MNILKNVSRRDVLRFGVQSAASSTMLATLGTCQRAMAAVDTSGYKALVCVFLYGGNDGFNVIVPRSNAAYNTYVASRRNLALSQNSLLPINPLSVDGNQYGLHPTCGGLQSLFESGRMAVMANVGTLIQPTTPAQFRATSVPLPPNLFSHSDQAQQWQTSIPNSVQPQGWGGRIADLLNAQGYGNPQLATNISLNGSNIWQGGRNTIFYTLGESGAPVLTDYQYSGYRNGARKASFDRLLQQATASSDGNLHFNEFTRTVNRTIESSQYVNNALSASPALTTAFPSSNIGNQLKLAARMIGARTRLGLSRQLFFIGLGGFDQHDDHLNVHGQLMSQLSAGLKSFYDATVELGIQNSVTAFTGSDFGRTLTTNGNGSDHGWGGHHLVIGGAVQGRRIYGQMPDLTLNGPNDAGSGRIVPTTSTDQYAATLARWFGAADSDLDLLFPNLRNFSQRNLGFV
ncbi:DUF1501 domain-containing protein [Nevskia sp.]|uniref:DUF1501 domain-containing protein n=1 Tax=Nevskia sp. TaxID=1929292 RepID=UPI0025FE1DCE|nr:DUF1501 domain-containing protein [Nevskia sp.]